MQAFIATLPQATRAKLAVRRAQLAAVHSNEGGAVGEAIAEIRDGSICYAAALLVFGPETTAALFEMAGVKVV